MKEYHTNKVLTAIDGWLNVFESGEIKDRNDKINAFNELSDYQLQLINHLIQCDTIDSEFTGAFSQIVDWFYNNYLKMIDEIVKEADENIGEIEQYFSGLTSNIDMLNALTSSSDNDMSEIRAYRAEIITRFNNMFKMLEEDDFISLSIDENEAHIKKLIEIISLMEHEGIIDNERFIILNEMINSLVEIYSNTEHAIEDEINDIHDKLETGLSSQTIWFEGHYLSLIDEISGMERKDEYDDATVKKQIKELELVIQFIEDDAVVSNDFLAGANEQVMQLTEEYETELALITELIKKRDEAAKAAAAAAAAAAARRNNAAANSNSSGTSSGNTSTGNSGSSSSGTQNQSSTVTASHNNRYPSISANCREMLARLVKLEAPNESADGKQAVAEVVLNRMISSRWNHANTVEEVIFDTRWGVQFTVKDLVWTERGTPRAADYAAVDRALAGPNVLSKEYMSFSMSAGNKVDVIWIGLHAFGK